MSHLSSRSVFRYTKRSGGKSIGIGVSMTVVAFLVIGVIVFLLMRLAKKVQNKEYERKREILEAKKNANVADGQTQVDATPGFGGTNAPNVQDQPRQ